MVLINQPLTIYLDKFLSCSKLNFSKRKEPNISNIPDQCKDPERNSCCVLFSLIFLTTCLFQEIFRLTTQTYILRLCLLIFYFYLPTSGKKNQFVYRGVCFRASETFNQQSNLTLLGIY